MPLFLPCQDLRLIHDDDNLFLLAAEEVNNPVAPSRLDEKSDKKKMDARTRGEGGHEACRASSLLAFLKYQVYGEGIRHLLFVFVLSVARGYSRETQCGPPEHSFYGLKVWCCDSFGL